MSFTIASDQGSNTLRLSSRRGSLSAPDPFAHNAKVEPPKGQASRLTIIHVPSSHESSSPVTTEQDGESRVRSQSSVSASPAVGQRLGEGHVRASSGSSEGQKKRMSFAHSSFSSSLKPENGGGPASDSASSRSRSSSSPASTFPVNPHTRSNIPRRSSAFHPRQSSLSPQQICDLAHSSLKMATAEGTPSVSPRPLDRASPLFYSSNDSNPSESNAQDLSGVFPTPFTPLPDSHYLPFLDRPSEVSSLLSSDANSRCLVLLKQTFPPHLRDNLGNRETLDPTEWSFRRLVSYITECPRSESSDTIWVTNIRRCILRRSEVIWERLKNVLGVPPELDVEDPVETEEEVHEESDEDGDGEEVDEESERAWVEPIYPVSSSPPQISVSETDDGGFGYRGRGNNMETIGEGEEYSSHSVSTTTSTCSEILDAKTAADPPSENIHALRLYTRMSSPSDLIPSSDPTMSPPTRKARSLSDGHANRAVAPLASPDHDRSFSFSHTRRPSTARPEFERGPGNPLFPSNFGCLSIGPTLPANNPMVRRHSTLAPPYPSSRYTLIVPASAHDGRSNRPISSGSDYAITLASGSDRSSVVHGPERPYR